MSSHEPWMILFPILNDGRKGVARIWRLSTVQLNCISIYSCCYWKGQHIHKKLGRIGEKSPTYSWTLFGSHGNHPQIPVKKLAALNLFFGFRKSPEGWRTFGALCVKKKPNKQKRNCWSGLTWMIRIGWSKSSRNKESNLNQQKDVVEISNLFLFLESNSA